LKKTETKTPSARKVNKVDGKNDTSVQSLLPDLVGLCWVSFLETTIAAVEPVNHDASHGRNPDASLFVSVRDISLVGQHGSVVHCDLPDNVGLIDSVILCGRHAHNHRHSKSGHDHSGCRSQPDKHIGHN